MPRSKSASVKKRKPARTAKRTNTSSSEVSAAKRTKRSLLVEMLSKKEGASIDQVVKMTGWLPHTGRAMISGLRKAGHKVETEPGNDGKTIYRIVAVKKAPGKASR